MPGGIEFLPGQVSSPPSLSANFHSFLGNLLFAIPPYYHCLDLVDWVTTDLPHNNGHIIFAKTASAGLLLHLYVGTLGRAEQGGGLLPEPQHEGGVQGARPRDGRRRRGGR